jgi:hypothetical protein
LFDVIYRWDHSRDHCKTETGFDSDHQKWAHILASLWLHHFQVYPCSFTGNITFLTYSSYLSWNLYDNSLNWWFVFSAASKQFLLVSLDHLHNIHGRLEETRSTGDHKLVVIFKWLQFDWVSAVISGRKSSWALPGIMMGLSIQLLVAHLSYQYSTTKTEINCFLGLFCYQ